MLIHKKQIIIKDKDTQKAKLTKNYTMTKTYSKTDASTGNRMHHKNCY